MLEYSTLGEQLDKIADGAGFVLEEISHLLPSNTDLSDPRTQTLLEWRSIKRRQVIAALP